MFLHNPEVIFTNVYLFPAKVQHLLAVILLLIHNYDMFKPYFQCFGTYSSNKHSFDLDISF